MGAFLFLLLLFVPPLLSMLFDEVEDIKKEKTILTNKKNYISSKEIEKGVIKGYFKIQYIKLIILMIGLIITFVIISI